jgi:hypothetical protein
MEPALKSQLSEAIAKAIELRKKGKKVTENGLDPVLSSVRRRLRKAKVWKKIQAALFEESFARAVRAVEGAQNRARSDAAQLSLPGFEHLPKRIPCGKGTSLDPQLAAVPQLLSFKAKYERRAEKDQRVVEELRQLAEIIAPYAGEVEMTVAKAYELAVGNVPSQLLVRVRGASIR